jgi:hypothetical protein
MQGSAARFRRARAGSYTSSTPRPRQPRRRASSLSPNSSSTGQTTTHGQSATALSPRAVNLGFISVRTPRRQARRGLDRPRRADGQPGASLLTQMANAGSDYHRHRSADHALDPDREMGCRCDNLRCRAGIDSADDRVVADAQRRYPPGVHPPRRRAECAGADYARRRIRAD